ncbi:MFS transporter [Streptomyces sp. NPDC059169]|uniref:MFS transporter n=1 Tax=unclassified Streptomyces TaxID=2593676 RepID=UPI0036C40E2C
MITGRAQGTVGQRDRAVLMACAAAGFTTLLDNSALNVALPSLRLSLAADVHQMQWIAAGYSLMFALTLVPGGRLGDTHGRKPYFVAGMAVFVFGGLLAAVSSDAWLLVACRLVQGAGAGLVNGQMIGIIQDSFTGPARARALGVYAAAASIAAALGPALGGALIAIAGPDPGWRLVLVLAAPFGAATLALATRCLPSAAARNARADVDVRGALLFAATTLAVLLPLVTSLRGAGLAYCAATVGVLAVFAVLHHCRTIRIGGIPLIAPALLQRAPYLAGVTIAATQFGAQMAASLALTMFLQDGLGLSAMSAAAVMLPMALAMAVTSSLAGRAADRFGPRLVTAGITLSVCCLLGAGAAAQHACPRVLPFLLGGTQLALGAAVGLLTAPLQAEVLRHAPPRTAGVAGGLLQMGQRLAAAVCVAAISGLYLNDRPSALAELRLAYGHAVVACACITSLGLALRLATRHLRPPNEPAPPPTPLTIAAPGAPKEPARAHRHPSAPR